jgi:hypothetical protein
MKTAWDRYHSDATYKRVVDTMESLIFSGDLTPAEMREAAVLASINFENKRIRKYHIQLTPELHEQLIELHALVGASK